MNGLYLTLPIFLPLVGGLVSYLIRFPNSPQPPSVLWGADLPDLGGDVALHPPAAAARASSCCASRRS